MEIGRLRICLDRIPSTMDLALALAEDGAPTGTVVQAGHQSAGRGRSGRTWEAAPWSSLLFSFIWHTRRERSGLGIVSPLIGLAVAETVEAFTDAGVTVKWPNDVLVEGRKVAGILAINRVLPGQPGSCLVAGIGLNVNNHASDLPSTATSLAVVCGTEVAIDDVRSALLGRLSAEMTAFEFGGETDLLPRIVERLAYLGERVTITDGPRTLEGVVRGIDPGGGLLLERPDGGKVTIVAGELTRGPRPDRTIPS